MIHLEVIGHERAVLQALAAALEREGIEVRGVATSTEHIRDLAKSERIDVVVAADGIGRDEVLDLARRFFDGGGEPKLLVTGVPDSAPVTMAYVEAGVSGCVPEDASLEELREAIRRVSRGEAWLSAKMTHLCMRRVAELVRLCDDAGINSEYLVRLTDRELEVLKLLGEQLSNAAIADQLFVEVGTIKSHVHNLLKKLEVNRRQDAVAYLTVARNDRNQTNG